MDTEYERSRLEQLKRGLYKPGEEQKLERGIPKLTKTKVDIEEDWKDTDLDAPRHSGVYHFTAGLMRKLVTLAVIAIVGSGSYLLYQFFDPLEKPSDKNIIITLDTPVALPPGVPADIVIRVANQNRVALEYANLVVVFPSGTRLSVDPDKDLRDQKKDLGMIEPGETVEFATKAIFLGEESEEKNIRAELEYRFDGMNSTFRKENERPIRLLSAPINLTVNMQKEVNAGQQITIDVSAIANTVIPLRDLFIKIEYPQNFTFQGAEPRPTFGNNIWRVGVLTPSSKFPIKIKGVLDGVDTDKRIFRTMVGVGADKTERDIATPYARVTSEIIVKRPFIGIKLTINGKPAGDALAYYGREITGVVGWKNNLPTRITNAQIEVRLTGVALDRRSVIADTGGFYRSIDNTIIWDSRGYEALAELESGEDGEVVFRFEPLPPVAKNELIINPVITAEVTVRGRRMSDTNVPEEIKTVMAQNVRVISDVQFVTRSLYYSGPFVNIGPLPPRVEQETTYTIIWSVVNTSNNIGGARVRGVLPEYVKWYGSVDPPKEKITFNKATNEILWEPGDIPAGTGIGGVPPKEVAFQVVLTPSLSQLKSAPLLVLDQTFSAVDTFTNTEISIEGKKVSTELSTDPSASYLTTSVVE